MKLPLTCGLGAAACGTGGFTDLPGGNQPPPLDRGASTTPRIEDGPRHLAFDLPHRGPRSIYVWLGS
jgi:hypothetical protein